MLRTLVAMLAAVLFLFLVGACAHNPPIEEFHTPPYQGQVYYATPHMLGEHALTLSNGVVMGEWSFMVPTPSDGPDYSCQDLFNFYDVRTPLIISASDDDKGVSYGEVMPLTVTKGSGSCCLESPPRNWSVSVLYELPTRVDGEALYVVVNTESDPGRDEGGMCRIVPTMAVRYPNHPDRLDLGSVRPHRPKGKQEWYSADGSYTNCPNNSVCGAGFSVAWKESWITVRRGEYRGDDANILWSVFPENPLSSP